MEAAANTVSSVWAKAVAGMDKAITAQNNDGKNTIA